MTLALYEDALDVLQDNLPDWWAKDGPGVLYAILVALAGQQDELSGQLETLFANQSRVTATLEALRCEYAYAFGIDYEQLPPTVDALQAYLTEWIGADGSTLSAIRILTSLLKTPANMTGTQLVFDAGGAGLTFPADGSGLVMFQQVQEIGFLSFPVDGSGLGFPSDGSGVIFPDVSGWVVITESPSSFTWTVTTKSYLTYDRAAFARAVERLRQAHLLPATIVESST